MSEAHAGRRVVVVGASLAGLTTAEALRNEGFDGDILVIGSEDHLPYSRPPLSKQVLLGEWDADRSVLRSRSELDALGIRVRLSTTASGLDLAAGEVRVGDERVRYDTLVIATGVGLRPLGVPADEKAVSALRTVDDARALRARIESARCVAVIGTGVLGSEMASAARRLGKETALIGRSTTLSLGTTGSLLSRRLVDLHRDNGVELHLGSAAVAVESSGGGHRVVLADGTRVAGELVVGAVGGMPHTDWLLDSGLTISDGVVCDSTGEAAPGVYAVGDVARWADPFTGQTHRVEHQANAIDQAHAVAGTIVCGRAATPAVPFFWADIHGVRIQAYGRFDTDASFGVLDDHDPERVLYGSHAHGRLRGIVGWNAPRLFRSARAQVDAARGFLPTYAADIVNT